MPHINPHRENFGIKAPIVEALIDLAAPATVEVEALRSIVTEIAGDFPSSVDQVAWDLAFNLNNKDSATASSVPTPRGVVMHSADRSRAVQFRRDGFTMSHLKPYGSWESLRADATRLWARFVDVARPSSVPRIDVRYINQLELPANEPLTHWLRLLPGVPPDSVLEDPAEFSMRTVHRHPATGAIAVVNLVQPHRDPSGSRVIVFDIDCLYDHLELDPNSSEIWERADQLREFKNDVFFGSITDHTRGLFR